MFLARNLFRKLVECFLLYKTIWRRTSLPMKSNSLHLYNICTSVFDLTGKWWQRSSSPKRRIQISALTLLVSRELFVQSQRRRRESLRSSIVSCIRLIYELSSDILIFLKAINTTVIKTSLCYKSYKSTTYRIVFSSTGNYRKINISNYLSFLDGSFLIYENLL